eukprot:CAMPEP_0197026550 /NCGR_PEP_ID=MMETSP1384-20130603/6610_1 /TAXON_ID=29189 /ORGANISM="Ammonia sp." /LENGTH=546 /DNA_ID=CAMNT_0042455235 /DNA_START=64 /DNA_END=1704 /DNA_ORIENTATION=-
MNQSDEYQPLLSKQVKAMQDPSASNANINRHKKLSFAQLSVIIFTLTCAGPFGIEEALQSGGALYTLLGLMLLPFIYAIPQSLMCAELGSMMPSHHGYIIWVFRGFEKDRFGHFLGFYNAIGCIVGMAKDIPIYIMLMLYYFKKLLFDDFNFEMSWFEEYCLSLFLILLGMMINIANITTLGNSAIIWMCIILLPFLIGFLYSLPQTDFNAWIDTTPQNEHKEYQFGLWLSTLLWLHTGWDSTGCLSAEIGFPKKKFFNAFVVAMVMDYVGYTIPLLGALTVQCTERCWDAGYLYTAYHAILPGLGLAVAFSGLIANFAIYNAEIAVQARAFWALSQPFCLLTKSGKMYVESHDGTLYDDNMEIMDRDRIEKDGLRRIVIAMLPRWLCGTIWTRTGAPVRGVLFQSALCCVLILFDFEFLLQATVLINCVTWCVELCSFLRLRYTEPETERPYKVPGGMFVAWLITLVKVTLVLVLFILVLRDHPIYILITIGFLIFTLIYYWFYLRYIEKRYKTASPQLVYEMVELAEDGSSEMRRGSGSVDVQT